MSEECEIRVNGRRAEVKTTSGTPLVDVLRDQLGLTGTKVFCRQGFCGACTVHLDGEAAASCLVPAGTVGEAAVTTIEGVSTTTTVDPLQQALLDIDAVQCGMCFPGMVMSLLSAHHAGDLHSEDDVRRAIVGNICRCTGYDRIVQAATEVLVGSRS